MDDLRGPHGGIAEDVGRIDGEEGAGGLRDDADDEGYEGEGYGRVGASAERRVEE